MAEKSFLEKFHRYEPSDSQSNLLAQITEYHVKIDVDARMVECDISLPAIASRDEIRAIEAGIAEVYELQSVHLIPHYPAELFDYPYIPELVKELEHEGSVSRGFFYDYSADIDFVGHTILFQIHFSQGGVNLLYAAQTPRIAEQIIAREFGLQYTVTVERDPQTVFDYDAFQREQEEAARKLLATAPPPAPASDGSGEHTAVAGVPRQAIGTDPIEVTYLSDSILRVGNLTVHIDNPNQLYGEAFSVAPIPMRNLHGVARGAVVLGKVTAMQDRESKGGDKHFFGFHLSDLDGSITVRLTLENADFASIKIKSKNDVIKGITAESVPDAAGATTTLSLALGDCVAVYGNLRVDKFTNELTMYAQSICTVKEVLRADNAPDKRVELHLHTKMSALDAVIPVETAINTAYRWGHPAIAITDHGTLQAYPEAMYAYEALVKDKGVTPEDFKVIYGVECYLVDDTARAVFGNAEDAFSGTYIVFDIETTGFSALNDAILEIGAVRITDGKVEERFQCFVNPERPVPARITELTGIDDSMVANGLSQKEAVEAFLAFAGDHILVAHNANFDVGFIRKAATDFGLPFSNSYLDTVALSRYVNAELKGHKLNQLVDYFGLGDFRHHRANEDAEVLALILLKMFDKLKEEGVKNIPDMVRAMSENSDPAKLRSRHCILLVKNKTGLKNLYRMVSDSYLKYFHREPRIPKTLLAQNREGLIVGSACEAGQVFAAILENQSDAAIEEIASFYDYLEIQPISNNRFLVDEGRVADEEGLRNLNRRIIALAEKLGKPVVATCDAHFLNDEDAVFRRVMVSKKFKDADRECHLYYRTTEEMLAEFDYLTPEEARAVVIDNPKRIADQIEVVRPIPKGTYTPDMEGAEEDLQRLCWTRAKELYGDPVPELVATRLERELTSIIKHGFAVLYMIAQKLVAYSESQGYLVGSRGSVGSSFVASMSGISEVNPLPPHYRCPNCKHSEFFTDGSVGSGYDMPTKQCPKCGATYEQDGHDIPFETFLGFEGDKSPDIDLNFSGDVQGRVHKYTEELFGAENVFRAGTIGTIAEKTAIGFYVRPYFEERGMSVCTAEMERIAKGCEGVARSAGQHPGGIIVVPKQYEVYEFTPVQHPAGKDAADIITTHFQFSHLHDTILKLDELGHDIPTKYKMLERYSNTSVLDVPMNDPRVYALLASTEPLGCDLSPIGVKLGTLGLPELGTRFIQQVLEDARPKNFADLLQISGLTHGTDVWLGNAQDLIKQGICDISKVIGTRDGIMLDLIRYGLPNKDAFTIMEAVRKGKGLKPEWETLMREHNVPDWYIGSCKKIKYMFPKAHAAAYVMSAIRLGWYKVNMPLVFYAAFLSVAPGGFDASVATKGKGGVLAEIRALEEKVKNKTATATEKEMLSIYYLVYECLARGISFLPPHLYHSDASAFLPEGNNIRCPFNSLPGLGDTAAQKIFEVCSAEKVISIEELQERTGVSKSVIELLKKNGVLDGLSETAQLSFF